MPFLDHLEELRFRILRSLAAIAVGFGIGLWAVQHFTLVALLKRPIEQYLTGGKLVVLSPTEPVLIVFKLGFVVGLVLASPVVLWQLWAFVAPALYEREKRAIVPSLFAGLALFLTGSVFAWLFLVPKALAVLFSFQSEAIAPYITYDAYFDFVLQVVLSLGISFELPLVIIILAWLGVVTPAILHRFRRYAVVLACIAGALLSPGTDLISMLMMTFPLILLYEVGFLGAVIIKRRRRKAAGTTAAILLAMLALPSRAHGQLPQVPGQQQGGIGGLVPGIRPGQGIGIGQVGPSQPLDTATARLLGIPTAPTRQFPQEDSVITELLKRPGYKTTRYKADSAIYYVEDRRIRLEGQALTEQQGIKLEADSVRYQEASCILEAGGEPHLFDKSQVLVGGSISYNTCTRRGVIKNALTSFSAGQANWFIRGNVAADSSGSRLYAAKSEITSCDLPTPHYHFVARQVKWVSKKAFVARPIVLYVRDVPIIWLPFMYQDIRPGRHSGILIPQFGFADLIPTSPSYHRQISNIGYYWATNDYMDVTFRLDWFSSQYVQLGASMQYNVLNRFMGGSFEVSRQFQNSGGAATSLQWQHRQQFDLNTSLNASLAYVSNSFVVAQNALNPLQNTQQVNSSASLQKRFRWGIVNLGGNRRQSLTDNSSSTQLPALTISPNPLDISRNITWSPNLSLTNDLTANTPGPTLLIAQPDGTVDTVPQLVGTRNTSFNFSTPFRLGSFNWSNSVSLVDQTTTARQAFSFLAPGLVTPADSETVSQFFPGDFSTTFDWQTSFSLPVLFQRSWRITPSVGVANKTGQAFAIRNRQTGGAWVFQGKRFLFGVNSTPTLFGFYPGFGPLSRIRHSFSPLVQFNYSPAASVPEAFARAIAPPGQPLVLRVDPTQTLSVGMSNTFEAKTKPPPGDTSETAIRKIKLLSITTSPISYDFEQAKKPGRTGWTTQTITNTFLSDLLPGFNLSVTHDLWRGVVGTDTAKFDPFLTSLQTNFTLSTNTFRAIGSIFGIGHGPKPGAQARRADEYSQIPYESQGARATTFFSPNQVSLPHQPFSVNLSYTVQRTRPIAGQPTVPSRKNLNFSTGLSPTRFWTIQWTAQYNLTDSRFESQSVALQRDLHDWRAQFNFTRNANTNFAVYFSIFLIDLPALKFDYNQATFEQ